MKASYCLHCIALVEASLPGHTLSPSHPSLNPINAHWNTPGEVIQLNFPWYTTVAGTKLSLPSDVRGFGGGGVVGVVGGGGWVVGEVC